MIVVAITVEREHVLTAISLWNNIWIGIREHEWLHLSSVYPWIYSKYISDMYLWSWRSYPVAEYWPKICSSKGQTGNKNPKNAQRCFQELRYHLFWVNVQAEVTHGTCVCWPPQLRADEFPELARQAHIKHEVCIESYFIGSSCADNISVSFSTLFAVESDPYRALCYFVDCAHARMKCRHIETLGHTCNWGIRSFLDCST